MSPDNLIISYKNSHKDGMTPAEAMLELEIAIDLLDLLANGYEVDGSLSTPLVLNLRRQLIVVLGAWAWLDEKPSDSDLPF